MIIYRYSTSIYIIKTIWGIRVAIGPCGDIYIYFVHAAVTLDYYSAELGLLQKKERVW